MPTPLPLVQPTQLARRISPDSDPLLILFDSCELARNSRRASTSLYGPGTCPAPFPSPSPFWTPTAVPPSQLAYRCALSDQFCQLDLPFPNGELHPTIGFSPTASSPTFSSILLHHYATFRSEGDSLNFFLPPHLSLEELAFAFNSILHSTFLSFASNPTHLVLLWNGAPLAAFPRSLPGFSIARLHVDGSYEYVLFTFANTSGPFDLSSFARHMENRDTTPNPPLASISSFPGMATPHSSTSPAIPPLGTATTSQLNSAHLAVVLDFARLKTTLPIPTSFGAGTLTLHTRPSLTSPFAPLRRFVIASDGLPTEDTPMPNPTPAPAAASSE